jgi:exodeoxyribonuclease III
MRIVSWNCCRRGFAGVIEALAPLSADLLFLQEVGCPGTKEPPCVWRGAYERQGVAIVALSGALTLSGRAPSRASTPVHVAGPTPFRALNVWAHPRPTYPADVHATLDRCRAALTGCAAVVAGDFNSSVTADTRRQPRHASLVARLRDEFGLVTAYHEFHDEQQGRESAPTYFHLRRPNAPWHIDYCFVPAAWATKLAASKCSMEKGGRR